MDNEKTYVEKVNDWLNADPKTRSIQEGATLMLQGNRNQILYKNVIHKSNFEKVEYELNKIIDGKRVIVAPVSEEVKELENNLPVTMENLQAKLDWENKGKRPDHEALPTAVQIAFTNNLEIYPRMRAIQERLKVLNEVGTATQRLPFLTELLELDEALRTNWETYDKFDVNAPVAAAAVKIPAGEKIDAKRVSANRKYLSDNKTKLTALIADGKTEKANELLEKMQVRFNENILNGETFAPEQLAELNALGVILETIVDPVIEEKVPEDEVAEETIVDPVLETETECYTVEFETHNPIPPTGE